MWKKGLFVKVFKKGDLHECNNWRGVTLLPVISKIFCRMLLERIKKGVDKNLRNEQAGFRSTTKQIFILRNILEQASGWRASLYAHFVDFEKAFDSVHRESLRNITWVRNCRDSRLVYDQVCGKTGVRDVGIPILTVLGLGQEEGTADKRRGIRCNFTTVLEDPDFAHDIALLSSTFNDLHEKTRRLAEDVAESRTQT